LPHIQLLLSEQVFKALMICVDLTFGDIKTVPPYF